jgi:uncharacterized protein
MPEIDLPCDSELFQLLVCPACHTGLQWVSQQLLCTNADCRRGYRVVDQIPVMLVEESEQLEPAVWQALRAQPGPVSGDA